jgi:tRNA(Ile)-lysidine synthase
LAPRRDSVRSLAERAGAALDLPAGTRLRAGLSGGLDSTVLVDVLAQLAPARGWVLEAMHVHHGLSPNADAWLEAARRQAAALGIAFRAERVRVPLADGRGLEAAARSERLAALSAPGADAVALAHHRDDQAETVLLQALRGTGLAGLSAMATDRTARGVRWVRPFLSVPRADLLAYARDRSLAWIEDETNASPGLARGALRTEVMPPLLARFPAARASLARLAGHAAAASRLLDDLARLDAGGGFDVEGLPCERLAALSPERLANVLRHFVQTRGARPPSAARLSRMAALLVLSRNDADARLVHDGLLLWRHGGRVRAAPDPGEVGPWAVAWRGESCVELGEGRGRVVFEPATGRGIRAALAGEGAWSFGPREGGERLRPAPGRPSRTLKNLLREAGLAPWERERLPLLRRDGALAWVPGIGVDAALAAGPGEAGLEPRWEGSATGSGPHRP